MAKKNKISNYSIIALVSVLAVYFVNFFSNNRIADWLVLNPKALIENYQVWRLFSFTFAPGSTEAVLLFAGVFYFISPKLEKILNTKIYPILLFLVVFLQGIVTSLLFWNTNVQVAGAEGLAFFVLTHTTLLRPNDRVYNMLGVKNVSFALTILLIWVAFKAGSISNLGVYNQAPSLLAALFGITSGILIYAQIRYFQRIIDKRKSVSTYKPTIPSPEELSLSLARFGSKLPAEKLDETSYYRNPSVKVAITDDPDLNEELLNDILDKINENGKASLTPSEIKFLNDYSNRL